MRSLLQSIFDDPMVQRVLVVFVAALLSLLTIWVRKVIRQVRAVHDIVNSDRTLMLAKIAELERRVSSADLAIAVASATASAMAVAMQTAKEPPHMVTTPAPSAPPPDPVVPIPETG